MIFIDMLWNVVSDFVDFVKALTMWDVISYLIILGMISLVGILLYGGFSPLFQG